MPTASAPLSETHRSGSRSRAMGRGEAGGDQRSMVERDEILPSSSFTISLKESLWKELSKLAPLMASRRQLEGAAASTQGPMPLVGPLNPKPSGLGKCTAAKTPLTSTVGFGRPAFSMRSAGMQKPSLKESALSDKVARSSCKAPANLGTKGFCKDSAACGFEGLMRV